MSALRQILVTLAIVAVAAGVWFGVFGEHGPEAGGSTRGGSPSAAAPVVLAAVEHAVSAESVQVVGTGQAKRSVEIYPTSSGKVVDVDFVAGQAVARDAPLVRLDDEAETLSAELAQIQLGEAEATMARYERLAPTRSIPQSEVDTARTALEAARNALASARLSLDRRVVPAPFDGVLGLPRVEIGDYVTTDTPLGTIDDRSAILIEFAIPERYAAFVGPGVPVSATTPSVPGQSFAGAVTAIDSRIDPATRTLVIRAEIPNPDDRLRPGMSFAVTLAFDGGTYPIVPEMALQWDRNGSFVWRIADDKAERVPVAIVQRTEGRILVDGALAEGDPVVVEGVQRLRPGGLVTVVDGPGAPTPVADAAARTAS